MWIGVIVGLVLGVITQRIEALVAYPIVFGFIGFVVSRLTKKGDSDASGEPIFGTPRETDLRAELAAVKDELRRAHQRIDELDQRLQELEPEAAPREVLAPSIPVPPEPIIVVAPIVETPAPPPVPDAPIPLPTVATTQPERAEQPIVYSVPQVQSSAPGTPAPSRPAAPALASVPPRREAEGAPPATDDFAPQMPELPEWLTGFFQRWVIGGNPIVKVGVLILFLGLAFLLRYVAEHATMPVEYRYAGVAAIGIALLLFGFRVRHKADNYGVILQGAGIAVLYLTTLAGMKIHPLIPPHLGFALLFGVAAFAVFLAVLQDALSLAVAAALGGFAAPVLASTGSENHLAFFAYLALLNVGIAAVAWFKAWRILNLIGFISTVALTNGWGQQYYTPALFKLVEPFLLAFFLLYVLIAFLFARRTLADAPETGAASLVDHIRENASKVSYVDGSLVFGVPMATFGMQYMIVRSFENAAAFSALGWGFAYIIFAFALFRGTGKRYALLSETMVALAVIFGSLAIPLGLEGKWTSAAWAVEAAGVYWVGLRQQRIHARAFALLLLIGAAIYFALDLRVFYSVTTVITGSWLGCLMLAASVWTVYGLLSRAGEDEIHPLERHVRPVLVAFGCALVALMPFLLLELHWAAASLAALGAVAVYAARPVDERALATWGKLYQLLAGALFFPTLTFAQKGVALGGAWPMVGATALLAAALLAAVWLAKRDTQAGDDQPPHELVLNMLVVMGGLLFVSLLPLFGLDWPHAALVWAAGSIVVMWWALRTGRPEAALCALLLQGAAGSVAAGRIFFEDITPIDQPQLLAAFQHIRFVLLMAIAVTAFIVARLLHRRGEPFAAMVGWGVLVWSIGWWGTGWETEFRRVLMRGDSEVALLAIAIATVALWWALARFAKWREMGQATLLYLPALVLIPMEMRDDWTHPLAGWGALVWPSALVLHAVMLRGQREWLPQRWQQAIHVGGVWLFMAVATFELQWQLGRWGGPEGAWATLAMVLVPLAYLAAVASDTVKSRWPMRDFRDSYAMVAAAPVAAFLAYWGTTTMGMGNGAAPLPHIPVLNPIELGQIAALFALTMWWRSERAQPIFQQLGRATGAVLALAAFAILTGVVLRTCHQWGGVPWTDNALMASMMVQTSLSIVWGTTAIALMLIGHFRSVRLIWIAGAALVAVVVGKLFLVELAARGSLERIVSFMVVGLLLLVVGYFAPLPPRRETQSEDQPASEDRA